MKYDPTVLSADAFPLINPEKGVELMVAYLNNREKLEEAEQEQILALIEFLLTTYRGGNGNPK